ncbi:MAG: anaerobic ribonucleoside-triphosphate reductase activating protein [Candidatus Caccosoma sp.]|nr:anaerobic ribonucleoside-triphosphate reductase activating protein [Candidatus Caccosoma sp.]
MYYGEIKTCDIANGIGVRVSLFVSGCRNCCKNCFNQMTWAFNYGKEFTNETMSYLLANLSNNYIDGLTILGGEPLEKENQSEVLNIVKKVKEVFPNKSIWLYTGFTFEEITSDTRCRANTPLIKNILENIDVLVDGRFIEEEKDICLHFRGSRNQRIINVKETLKNNKLTILDI